MKNRLLATIVSVLLFASPLLASAQATQVTQDTNASLIALLTQLVHILEQELANLEASLGQTQTTPPAPDAFLATPSSGTAPLTVNFSGTAYGSYSLAYGDGSVGPNIVCDFNINSCVNNIQQTHTYQSAGTYTATMQDASGSHSVTITVSSASPVAAPCPVYTFPACTGGPYVPQTTDANGCTVPGHYQCTLSSFSASLTSGQAPLTVTFSGVDSAGMNFGDGSLKQASDNQTIGTISHTYTTAGTYTATMQDSSGSHSVTITVTSDAQT
jgi:PKD repeat protein